MSFAWWHERAPRERLVLGCGAALLVLLGLWLALAPVLEERAHLRAALPGLQADLAWMRTHRDEVVRLRGNVPESQRATLADAVRAALTASGLAAQVTRLDTAAAARVHVEFDAAAHAALIDLLMQLERHPHLSVAAVQIERLAERAGMVAARLELAADVAQ